MGTTGWNPSDGLLSEGNAGLLCCGGGFSISMQRRMSEWQKKIVIVSSTMMKRMWISWPRSEFVRAIARSVGGFS